MNREPSQKMNKTSMGVSTRIWNLESTISHVLSLYPDTYHQIALQLINIFMHWFELYAY